MSTACWHSPSLHLMLALPIPALRPIAAPHSPSLSWHCSLGRGSAPATTASTRCSMPCSHCTRIRYVYTQMCLCIRCIMNNWYFCVVCAFEAPTRNYYGCLKEPVGKLSNSEVLLAPSGLDVTLCVCARVCVCVSMCVCVCVYARAERVRGACVPPAPRCLDQQMQPS